MDETEVPDRTPTNEQNVARFCPVCGKITMEATCLEDSVATIPRVQAAAKGVDPMLGTTVADRYRVERLLGEGGMGRVYVATQLSLGVEVALKIVLPDRESGEAGVQRFYREARAATRISSPHAVRVSDFGVDGRSQAPYIVMELLKGTTLADRMAAQGALSIEETATICSQIASALVEAERESIVHRDLKPDNVFLIDTADGRPFAKVMDFGIARSVTGMADGLGSVTKTGAAVGTPAYMSPEQATGKPVDTRSDLYALGCLLHEMLIGERVFPSNDSVSMLIAHVTAPPPILPEVLPTGEITPESLRQLHARLLCKSPADRPGSARGVLDLCRSLAEGRHVDADALLAGRTGAVAAPSGARNVMGVPTGPVETAPLGLTGRSNAALVAATQLLSSTPIRVDPPLASPSQTVAPTDAPPVAAPVAAPPTPAVPTKKFPVVMVAGAAVVIAAVAAAFAINRDPQNPTAENVAPTASTPAPPPASQPSGNAETPVSAPAAVPGTVLAATEVQNPPAALPGASIASPPVTLATVARDMDEDERVARREWVELAAPAAVQAVPPAVAPASTAAVKPTEPKVNTPKPTGPKPTEKKPVVVVPIVPVVPPPTKEVPW